MTNPYHDFPAIVKEVPSLVHYLAQHQPCITGPRTLAQTYTDYRRHLMSGAVKLVVHEHERILRMNPDKVNWGDAYEWWKTCQDSMP